MPQTRRSKEQIVEPKHFDRAAHLLKLASKATARAMQDRLAEHSVAYGHWTFLRILWREEGLSVTELSKRASVAKPATVAAIRSMEELGYVRRRKSDENQKNVYIDLTSSGRALEKILVPLALEVNDLAMRGIGKTNQKIFKDALVAVIRNLETEETPK
jgi:DNA-binding MarR family transcriptional regulator